MKQRLQQLLQRIAIACEQAQREPQSVRLLPVSKTFSHELVQQAITLGLTRFGENRIQDIRSRYEYFAEQPVQWVMIGHAQTNKARDIARYADELQSLDRLALAEALQRRLDGEQRCLPVYIQVKTAQEDSKFGLDPSQLMPFLARLKHFDRLQPQGLMTMATQTDDPKEIRRCFAQLRLLRDQAQEAGYENITRLSMGMSGDFELAIAEGATDIRVGSALFGHRA